MQRSSLIALTQFVVPDIPAKWVTRIEITPDGVEVEYLDGNRDMYVARRFTRVEDDE